jgi:hypothetical protein
MSIKRDRKHKPDKQLNTHKKPQIAQNTKQDRLQKWTKPQAKKKIPITKARVSLQSEEPLKFDCLQACLSPKADIKYYLSVQNSYCYQLFLVYTQQ